MKLDIEVNADDTVEELKEMADELIAGLAANYLPYLFLFLGMFVIILVLTSCCGVYLAIWLHRSCHCRKFRCCCWIECGRDQELSTQQQKKRHRRLYINKNEEEIYVL